MLLGTEYLETECSRTCRFLAVRFVAALALLVAGATNGCAMREAIQEQSEPMHPKTIEQVQQEHTDAWLAIPGVVGTGIGQCSGKPCILIFTTSNPERVRRKIPSAVEGYPVVIQRMGEVHALDTP